MSAEIVNISGGLLTIKASGILTYPELKAAERASTELIHQQGKIRVLVILEDFRGWAQEEDWGDTTFLDEHDPFIERIAIVGAKRWEESALGFHLNGLRKAAVEYFQPHELETARAWLA